MENHEDTPDPLTSNDVTQIYLWAYNDALRISHSPVRAREIADQIVLIATERFGLSAEPNEFER